ncbi:MAG: hypothetical protein QM682_13745 [Paracoccus sp. (in: a-proteobacteria)]|uniref:hypothetical protein n=1 Tax=Paracoccus sp. TaxID=267 RepID=UPI0039E5A72B
MAFQNYALFPHMTVLDNVGFGLKMRAEIRRIHNQLGATTIYVTHDQDEALSLADRIVVLRDGSIRQVGAPHELYESPAYLDVAEFMGFRNRLTGRAMNVLSIGDTATLAARGDDVTESGGTANGVEAVAETIEYRGRECVGTARSQDGTELIFHAARPVETGARILLGVDAGRAPVYAGGRR